MFQERLLQRMQFAVSKALDGRDLAAVLHHGEREARIDAPPVEQHRAGAALAVVATLLGSGQVEMVAQGIEQRGPRRDFELPLHAIDDQANAQLAGRRDRIRISCRNCGHERLHRPPLRLNGAADGNVPVLRWLSVSVRLGAGASDELA